MLLKYCYFKLLSESWIKIMMSTKYDQIGLMHVDIKFECLLTLNFIAII